MVSVGGCLGYLADMGACPLADVLLPRQGVLGHLTEETEASNGRHACIHPLTALGYQKTFSLSSHLDRFTIVTSVKLK